MGFRDYYRQFDDFDENELNRERRARRRREKALALERLPDIDLSGTEWPDLPHSEIANAAIARARGLVNRYPDRHAGRRAAPAGASATDVDPERIVLGNGAAELLQSAALSLLGRGDELVMPWPSYPLYPLLASHAGARPLACDRGAVLDSVGERTRAVVICNPNDPTGALRARRGARRAARRAARARLRAARRGARPLPGRRARWTPACAWWTRSRACSWCARSRRSRGCPGCARATPWARTPALLAAVAPNLGVNALTQAAVEHALRTGEAEIERRRAAVSRERALLIDDLRALGLDVTDSQANFVWLAAPGRAATSWRRRCAARA